jgi:CRISPR-associated protein Cpf1
VECKDYNDLLDARSGNRDFARKNWQTIGTIKELKDGYVSHVVRKIVDLAVKYGAFIVLEDLNIGFKRGRQKIEKSVYQKLELAVAKKLNFLVDKDAHNGEIGSVTKALQLTPPVTNFGDMEGRKHFGMMLYTRADYTSQTDPKTGWRKTIYLKKGSEENTRKQILEKFDDIRFDGKNYAFTYTDKNTNKQWTLYSGTKDGQSLERYRGERGDQNEWTSTLQDVNKTLNGIFTDFDKNDSIYQQIKDQKVELKKINDKHTTYETLRFAIEMIQQIRNTGTSERDADFILSPVRDENDNHFDSRAENGQLPTSGDANGAYNIARKGIVVNEHILRGYKLYISDWEWDAWLAGKEIWEQWLKVHQKELVSTQKKKS